MTPAQAFLDRLRERYSNGQTHKDQIPHYTTITMSDKEYLIVKQALTLFVASHGLAVEHQDQRAGGTKD